MMATHTKTLPQVTPVHRQAKYGLLVKVLLMPFRPILTLYLMYRLGFIRVTNTQTRLITATLGAIIGAGTVAGIFFAFGVI